MHDPSHATNPDTDDRSPLCLWPGCSNRIPESRRDASGYPSIYCSTRCEDEAATARKREAVADDDDPSDCPIPLPGVDAALAMLWEDDPSGLAQLRAVARSDDWTRLAGIERCVVADWFRGKLRHRSAWSGAVGGLLGTMTRAGVWRDAPEAPAPAELSDPDPRAWLRAHLQPEAAELVPTAPGIAYSRRAVLVHANRGQGKTTYAAFMVDQALRGGLRVLLLVDDDPESWAAQLTQRETPVDGLLPLSMATVAAPGALESAVEKYRPDVLVVDSWRRWAFASGIRDAGGLNDEAQCGPVADRLVDVARSGPAVVLLANEPKGGESSRGSVAPEDAVNGAVRRLTREGDVTTIATADKKARHGVPAGPWHMTMTPDGFDPDPDRGQRATVEAHREALDKMLPEVRALLEDSDEPMTVNQIVRALPGKSGRRVRDVVDSALNVAVHVGTIREVKVIRRGSPYSGFEAVHVGTPEERFPDASPTLPREASEDARQNASPPPFRGAGSVGVHERESDQRPPAESGEAFEGGSQKSGGGGVEATEDEPRPAALPMQPVIPKASGRPPETIVVTHDSFHQEHDDAPIMCPTTIIRDDGTHETVLLPFETLTQADPSQTACMACETPLLSWAPDTVKPWQIAGLCRRCWLASSLNPANGIDGYGEPVDVAGAA